MQIDPQLAGGLVAYAENLSAAVVDDALRRADGAMEEAQACAILWFAEVQERRLYKDFGFSSILLYATQRLGYSRTRTYRYLRLANELKHLPRLRKALVEGELGWTSLRQLVRVAGPRTEERWLGVAKRLGRRELEVRVGRMLRRRAAEARRDPRQADLGEKPPSAETADAAAGVAAPATVDRCGPEAVAVTRAVVKAPLPEPGGAEMGREAERGDGLPTADSDQGTTAIGRAATGDLGEPRPSGPSDEVEQAVCDSQDLLDDAPVAVTLRLSPVDLARYEALMERIRKLRAVSPRASREEIILAGLDALATGRGREATGSMPCAASPPVGSGASADPLPTRAAADTGGGLAGPEVAAPSATGKGPDQTSGHAQESRALKEWPRGHSASCYRIVIYRCECCGRAAVRTAKGMHLLSPGELAALSCDAVIERMDGGNEATIPPRVRRAVLARDRHQCRVPGCEARQFLELHHLVPREAGGPNTPENLVTLCSTCHRDLHERAVRGWPFGEAAPAGD